SSSSGDLSELSELEEEDRPLPLLRPLYYAMSGFPDLPPRNAADLAAIADANLVYSERTLRSLAWFRNAVLRFFCWQFRRSFMELTLRQNQRSISASVAAWGRTQHELQAEEVLGRATAQMDEQAAARLRRAFTWLQEALRQAPERNDRAWIITTGNQFCPPTRVLHQRLGPHIVAVLRRHLQEELADEVAETILNMAPSMGYQDYLTALLPWLDPTEQLNFQQWFQEYEQLQRLALPERMATNYLEVLPTHRRSGEDENSRTDCPGPNSRDTGNALPGVYRRRRVDACVDQVNHLIAQAELAAPHGLQGLYRLSRKLAPKTGKKSIHFRKPDGSLMTDQEELDSLTSYFRDLYRADLCQFTSWSLQLPLNISLEEVLDALQQMSAQKALPPQQAPAVLWKTAQLELAPRICSDFNQVLVPGPLNFPESWNAAYMDTLLEGGLTLSLDLSKAYALTGYADDFLVNWEIRSPRDFTNACASIPKILAALQNLGMSISLDKTVILLALKGRAAPQLLKTYTCHKKTDRFLRLAHGAHTTLLPISLGGVSPLAFIAKAPVGPTGAQAPADNTTLLQRLDIPHPMQQLSKATLKRIALSKPHIQHLQPEHVIQWWDVIANSFSQHALPPTQGVKLVEVSQYTEVNLTNRWSACPILHAAPDQARFTTLAERKQLKELASAIRASGKLVFCPECGAMVLQALVFASAPLQLPFNMAVPTMEAKDREELIQAQAEFEQFGQYMKANARSVSPTVTPMSTTPSHSTAPPAQEDMDVDRSKRTDDAPPQLEPPTKWAKGDAKGDPKQDSGNLPQASGKGSSGELLSKAAVALGAQTSSGNASSPSDRPPQELTTMGPKASPPSPPNQDNPAPLQVAKNHQGGWGGWRGNGGRSWGSNQGRSQDRSRRGQDDDRWNRNQNDKDREREMEDLREMIRHLARLALRLEDAMSICNLDNEFILFFQTGSNPWSITKPLFETAADWKARKESDPSSLSQPLRSVLFYCVWTSLLTQLRKMEEASESSFINEVKGRGLTEDNS
ncbi:unnamed protein product, partial [Symbiodinium necroappetens]